MSRSAGAGGGGAWGSGTVRARGSGGRASRAGPWERTAKGSVGGPFSSRSVITAVAIVLEKSRFGSGAVGRGGRFTGPSRKGTAGAVAMRSSCSGGSSIVWSQAGLAWGLVEMAGGAGATGGVATTALVVTAGVWTGGVWTGGVWTAGAGTAGVVAGVCVGTAGRV